MWKLRLYRHNSVYCGRYLNDSSIRIRGFFAFLICLHASSQIHSSSSRLGLLPSCLSAFLSATSTWYAVAQLSLFLLLIKTIMVIVLVFLLSRFCVKIVNKLILLHWSILYRIMQDDNMWFQVAAMWGLFIFSGEFYVDFIMRFNGTDCINGIVWHDGMVWRLTLFRGRDDKLL